MIRGLGSQQPRWVLSGRLPFCCGRLLGEIGAYGGVCHVCRGVVCEGGALLRVIGLAEGWVKAGWRVWGKI